MASDNTTQQTQAPAQGATSDTPQGVLMISPQGETAYVPEDKVNSAQNKGAKLGVRMSAPDGSKAVVPFDQQDAAQKKGATWDVHPDNEAVKNFIAKPPKEIMDD